MSKTKEALKKLNKQQKDTLETWAYMAIVAEERGRDIYKEYHASMRGYLRALEELGAINQTDSKLIWLYVNQTAIKEIAEDE